MNWLFAPHSAPELHGHLVLALPRCSFGVESHGDIDRDPVKQNLFTEHAQVRDGHVHMSDKPGFGVEINWDFANKHRA